MISDQLLFFFSLRVTHIFSIKFRMLAHDRID